MSDPDFYKEFYTAQEVDEIKRELEGWIQALETRIDSMHNMLTQANETISHLQEQLNNRA